MTARRKKQRVKAPKVQGARTRSRKVKPIQRKKKKVRRFDIMGKDRTGEDGSLRKIVWGCFATLALISLLVSANVGLNADENVQVPYSENLLKYYTSLGSDISAFSSSKGDQIRYYGGIYEIPVAVVAQTFGLDQNDPGYFTLRHVLTMLFGLLAIFYAFSLARALGGWRAGLLALGIMFLSPRFLGHSMINPKDIPFAAGYIMSIFYIYQVVRDLPKVSYKKLLLLILGIGICVGVRINGGMLLVAYLLLALGMHFLFVPGIRQISSWRTMKPYLVIGLLTSVGGLLCGLLFWPYGLANPLAHVPEAMEAFSNFQTAIRVLFDGTLVWSVDIPFQYVSSWMLFTLPPIVLVGIVLLFAFLRSNFKSYAPFGIGLAIFTFVFPVVYVIVKGSALYDGWRHFSFVYPSLVVLSALAWHQLLDRYWTSVKIRYGLGGILVLLLLHPLLYQVRNASNMYTYFNPLIGGIKGAFGHYELDYWGTSTKQAFNWMEDEDIISVSMEDTITIASNFSYALDRYAAPYNGKVKTAYVRWRDRHSVDWDYSIFVNRFVDGSYLRGGYWPPEKTIHSVEANGTSICVVQKADDARNAYYGDRAIKGQRWDEAIGYLSREVQNHPTNELAWVGLGMAYLNKSDFANARGPLDRALAITPENQNALNFLGYYHYQTGNPDAAITVFKEATDIHKNNATAFYYWGLIELGRKNYTMALDRVSDCITADGRFRQCYQLGASVYDAMGDATNAQIYRDAMSQL